MADEAIDSVQAALYKMEPPKWAQTICIVWPMVATLICFLYPLIGFPASIDGYAYIAAFSLPALLLLSGTLVLERWAYIGTVIYAGLWAIYFLSYPMGGLAWMEPVTTSLGAIHILVVVAAWRAARSKLIPKDEAFPVIAKFRKTAIWAAGFVALVAAGIYANSFRTSGDGTGRLASRAEMVGDWWGIREPHDYERDDDREYARITKLSLREDGTGQLINGRWASMVSSEWGSMKGPWPTYWLMRGHQLHLGQPGEHGYYPIEATPMLSNDGQSMTLPIRSYMIRGVKFYRGGTPEAQRLEDVSRKAAEELKKFEKAKTSQ